MNGLVGRWVLFEENPAAERLAQSLGLPMAIARVLTNRGIVDEREAELFLYGSWAEAPSPFLFSDLKPALNRLNEAIAKKEKIIIFGDYDADGILALVMLYRALRSLGAVVDYYIPDRMKEGYGLKSAHLELIEQRGAKVVVTVDCGIKANSFVERAQRRGIDVIITDHHQPGDEVPLATAVLNPHLVNSGYPFKYLTGVGVAFKLVQAILEAKGKESLLRHYTKLVAIGTVTDVAPLIGENRLLVRHGLKTLSETRNLGLKSLLSVSGLHGERITEWDVGYRLGPRVNAAGRMASADLAVRLFLTDSPEEAASLAAKLNELNNERQQAEEKILGQALTSIEKGRLAEKYRVLILGCEAWHRGIIGIVASRLKEQFHRPVILFSYENERGHGSGRSISSFSLIRALHQCGHLFEEFGGHPHAAGCILRREKIAELKAALNVLGQTWLKEEDLRPTLIIDCPLRFSELSKAFLEAYSCLSPFGPGNPRPLFLFSGVEVVGKTQAANNRFTRLSLEQDGRVFEGTLGDSPGRPLSLEGGARISLVASPQISHFWGEETLSLNIEDWGPIK